jgi:hypothetical protein
MGAPMATLRTAESLIDRAGGSGAGQERTPLYPLAPNVYPLSILDVASFPSLFSIHHQALSVCLTEHTAQNSDDTSFAPGRAHKISLYNADGVMCPVFLFPRCEGQCTHDPSLSLSIAGSGSLTCSSHESLTVG